MPDSKTSSSLSPILSFDQVTRIHLLLLRAGGLLTFSNPHHNLTTLLLGLWSHLCESLITLSLVWAILSAEGAQRYNIEHIAEAVGHCGGHTRFLILYLNREKLAECIRISREFWAGLDCRGREIVATYVGKSVKLVKFYGGACGFMCVAFTLTTQIAPVLEADERNVTGYSKSLPYSFVVEVDESPWYELTFVMQMIYVLWACAVTTGVDTAAPFLVMMSCGHLHNLGLAFDRVTLATDLHVARYNLVSCIRYHQRILELCRRINDLMSFVFLSGLMSTTYNISLIGLKLIGDDPEKLKYVAVLVIFIIQMLVCQWAPDVLLSQSRVLTDHAYFIPRYLGYEDRSLGQLLRIVLARCQIPIQLKAGGYVKLSMESFGSLLTSALSFFTVLNNLN